MSEYLVPEGQVAPSQTGNELVLTPEKKMEMAAKVKELLTKPLTIGEACDALEQYYVFQKNEHYTSVQLKEVVLLAKQSLEQEE